MSQWDYMRCLFYTAEEDVDPGIFVNKETHYYIKVGDKIYKDEDADLYLSKCGEIGWELISTTPIVGPISKYSGLGGVAVALTAGPVAQTSVTATNGIMLWFKREIRNESENL